MSGVTLERGQMLVTVEAQPERQKSPARQSKRQTDGHLFCKHPPEHMILLQANLWTWSHAQSGLDTLTFHFSAIRPRDESIGAAQWNTRESDMCWPHGPPSFKSLTTTELIQTPGWWKAKMESTFYPWQSATYSEGERQLPIGLAWWVQVDILPLPALVICALALREKRRDTDRGVKQQRGEQGVC